MSSFICPHCGAAILEGKGGHYKTGCPHYPLEKYAKKPSLTLEMLIKTLKIDKKGQVNGRS